MNNIAVFRPSYTSLMKRDPEGKDYWEVEMIKIGEASSHQDALERYGVSAITQPIKG